MSSQQSHGGEVEILERETDFMTVWALCPSTPRRSINKSPRPNAPAAIRSSFAKPRKWFRCLKASRPSVCIR